MTESLEQSQKKPSQPQIVLNIQSLNQTLYVLASHCAYLATEMEQQRLTILGMLKEIESLRYQIFVAEQEQTESVKDEKENDK